MSEMKSVRETKEATVDRSAAATVLAVIAFLVGTAGAVAFATIYTLGPDAVRGMFTQALGLSLAVAVAGIGFGLVFWAHGLMPGGPDVEDREFEAPNPAERRETVTTFERQTGKIGRRGLLGRLFLLAGSATGIAALFPIRSLAPDPFPERTRTSWREGLRLVREDGTVINVDDLEENSFLTVFPEGYINAADTQTLLIRLPQEVAGAAPASELEPVEGYIAYSKVCTHAGCPVGLYQKEAQRLLCPCHQSAFDVLAGAEPVFGPATRPLPQLPLAINDAGELIALGDFEHPIGPGFWTYPSRARKAEG